MSWPTPDLEERKLLVTLLFLFGQPVCNSIRFANIIVDSPSHRMVLFDPFGMIRGVCRKPQYLPQFGGHVDENAMMNQSSIFLRILYVVVVESTAV
jgi:hypothetical protein